MNKTTALTYGRRFSAVFVAFAMLTVCLFAGMPAKKVSAAPSATAKVSTGKIEPGSTNYTIEVTVNDDTCTEANAPNPISVLVKGEGSLGGSVTVQATNISLTVDATTQVKTLSYTVLVSGSDLPFTPGLSAGLNLEATYAKTGGGNVVVKTTAPVAAYTPPVDDGGGDYVPPVTPEPVGNQIIVKPGAAIPEMNAGETKTLTIPLVASGNRIPGKTQITVDPLPEKTVFELHKPHARGEYHPHRR